MDNPEWTGLWLGTGTGKTRTALSLAKGDILVICPKTQKEDRNWEREQLAIVQAAVGRYKGDEKVKVMKDRLTVMSKEEFRRDAATLPRFNTVIVDEAHTCLGMTPNTRQRAKETIPKASQLYEALDAYLRRTKPDRLYLCTATIMKSPFTVYAAGCLLGKMDRTMVGFFAFRHKFYTKLPMPGREVWVPKKDEKTKADLAHYVRSIGYVGRLSDYFDMPEQTFKDDYVELTEKQKQRIKEMRIEQPEPIVQLGKRLQIENGILSGDEFTVSEFFANGKLDKILDYASEFPQMIVFSRYLAQIEQIKTALEKEGRKVFVMTGGVKGRGMLIAEVNRCKEYVFIVSAQISAGWEVPQCPVMVFASRTYSWVDFDQARGRILRASALKKNLFINLIVRDGVDDGVHKALVNKQDFSERIYLNI